MIDKNIRSILEKYKISKLLSDKEVDKITKDIKSVFKEKFFDNKRIAEYNKILIDKWIEGEKIKKDPGNEFVLKWIEEHGKEFNEQFEKSDCRICTKVNSCKNIPKYFCDDFEADVDDDEIYLIEKIVDLLDKYDKDTIIKHYTNIKNNGK